MFHVEHDGARIAVICSGDVCRVCFTWNVSVSVWLLRGTAKIHYHNSTTVFR